MSDDLIAFLRACLAGAADGHTTFQLLSDEETAAIEGDEESEFTVQPWLEAQPDIDATVGARVGRRSLFLRGLLEVVNEAGPGEPRLAPTPALQRVIDGRRLGVGHILARGSQGARRTAHHSTLQPELGTFEEEIDEEGIHFFSACTYATAIRRLAAWALPDAHHGGAQMRTRISADRWPLWIVNELGVDVRVVELNLFLPEARGAGLRPETWVLAHAHGVAVLGLPDGGTLHIASMTQETFEDRLRERLGTALGISL